jgi:hypothetical protein
MRGVGTEGCAAKGSLLVRAGQHRLFVIVKQIWSWDGRVKKGQVLTFQPLPLKGPKLEIFGSRVFPQIRPVWVGDLGTRRKNSKFDGLGVKIAVLYFLAMSPTLQSFLSAIGDGVKKF